MKYIFFFAIPVDIGPVLRCFEANAPLKFVDPDVKATPHRAIYLSSSQIPSPGHSTSESGAGSQGYIVSHRDTKNVVDTFVDRNGQRRWMIGNGDKADTVMLTLAGLWTTGTLLPGNMSTLHRTPVAQQLMRWFLGALKQEGFLSIEPWWLGREALAMLRTRRRIPIRNAKRWRHAETVCAFGLGEAPSRQRHLTPSAATRKLRSNLYV